MARNDKRTNREVENVNPEEDERLSAQDAALDDDTLDDDVLVGDGNDAPDDDDENPEGWSRGEESFEGNAMQVDAAGGDMERPKKKKK